MPVLWCFVWSTLRSVMLHLWFCSFCLRLVSHLKFFIPYEYYYCFLFLLIISLVWHPDERVSWTFISLTTHTVLFYSPFTGNIVLVTISQVLIDLQLIWVVWVLLQYWFFQSMKMSYLSIQCHCSLSWLILLLSILNFYSNYK